MTQLTAYKFKLVIQRVSLLGLLSLSQAICNWGHVIYLKARSKHLTPNLTTHLLGFILASLLALAPLSALAAKPVILIYGDSLSAAYGLSQEQGWVALLGQKLKQNNLNYQVVNASISGETTSGGLSRIDQALASHQPSLILIELGANDGLRGLAISEMRKNLNAMIVTAKKNKAKVILIGMQIPPNYGAKYARDFKESYVLLARQHHLRLVPFLLDGVAGNPELNQEDGLHPTAKAEPRVLNNVWEVLQQEINH